MKYAHTKLYHDRADNSTVEAIEASNAMDLSTPEGRFMVVAGDFLIDRGPYEIGMGRSHFLDRYREEPWPPEPDPEPDPEPEPEAPAEEPMAEGEAAEIADARAEAVPDEAEPVDAIDIPPDTTEAAAAPAEAMDHEPAEENHDA